MMATPINFLLDFDSTLIRLEMMDVMAEVAIPDGAARSAVRMQLAELTDAAMAGRMDYRASLRARLELLRLPRTKMDEVAARLLTEITPSFQRNRAFLAAHAERIHVLTGGFREMLEPVIRELGLRPEQLHANALSFDAQGLSDGCDWNNPLSRDGGKIEVVRTLRLDGKVVVVGDGWSDYRIRAAGLAQRFYAFTENIARPEVVAKADHVAPSFEEVLYDLGLHAAVSYPKNRLKVLLLENIHPEAAAAFTKEGYAVESVAGSLDETALAARLAEVAILGIRSKTQLNERALAGARRLLAVGAFCIGTNQIDLHACERKGVAAFNAPFSNTRSVVELALAEIILLMRGIPEKLRLMDRGLWDKSAQGAHEVRGKRLGIIGYGNIGMQLSVLAEALGMEVSFYDVAEKLALGNAHKCATLDELLTTSDAVTVHVDGRKENRHLIGVREFARMRPGAVFLNLSRGHVADLEA